MAVVSNFDLRLRPLLEALGLDELFDALIISAEVHFWATLRFAGRQPAQYVEPTQLKPLSVRTRP